MNLQAMPAFLVVDDNVPLRNIILRVIRKLSPDAAVIEVDRVEDALSALQARPFTAMIIDYRLPDGDGVEVIRWARSHEMALPIIAISGLNVEREVQAVGANYTLSKPFHIDRLTQMLRAIVEQSSHPDVASNH